MAAPEIKPMRTKRDYEASLKAIEGLWGAKTGTPHGDRLDVLATLVDAYEIRWTRLIQSRPSSSVWSRRG